MPSWASWQCASCGSQCSAHWSWCGGFWGSKPTSKANGKGRGSSPQPSRPSAIASQSPQASSAKENHGTSAKDTIKRQADQTKGLKATIQRLTKALDALAGGPQWPELLPTVADLQFKLEEAREALRAVQPVKKRIEATEKFIAREETRLAAAQAELIQLKEAAVKCEDLIAKHQQVLYKNRITLEDLQEADAEDGDGVACPANQWAHTAASVLGELVAVPGIPPHLQLKLSQLIGAARGGTLASLVFGGEEDDDFSGRDVYMAELASAFGSEPSPATAVAGAGTSASSAAAVPGAGASPCSRKSGKAAASSPASTVKSMAFRKPSSKGGLSSKLQDHLFRQDQAEGIVELPSSDDDPIG